MDVSTLMKLALSANSTKTISKTTEASETQVSDVISAVLPLLLQGAATQATSKETAASFDKAVTEHAKEDTMDLSKFLSNVDVKDGAKIVQHLLGSNTTASTQAVAKQAGVSERDVTKIMSTVAPLLLSVIGQQKTKHSSDNSSALINTLMTGVITSALTKSTTSSAGSSSKASTVETAANVLNIVSKLIK